MYSNSQGVIQDPKQAALFYKKAAEQYVLFLGSIDFFEPYPVYIVVSFFNFALILIALSFFYY